MIESVIERERQNSFFRCLMTVGGVGDYAKMLKGKFWSCCPHFQSQF